VHWYTREHGADDLEIREREKREEMKRLKDAEEEALSLALGFAPSRALEDNNDIDRGAKRAKTEKEEEIERLEKEERRKEKE
jgi:hypothetical protein